MSGGLQLRIGRNQAGRDLFLDLGRPGHAIFSGATRSGKSTLVYGLLAQCRGLPVQVAGIDPSGVLLNALGAEGLGGDSLRVLTLSDPERVKSVCAELIAEMDKRINNLLQLRRDKFNPQDFSPDFPLLIFLLEEYPGTLAALQAIDQASGAKPVERIETKVRATVQRWALESAKVGGRLWVIAQRSDASLLTGVLRSQLTQKFSFAQDPDGLRMLHPNISDEQITAVSDFQPGMGYLEIAGQQPLTRFRADYCSYEQLANFFAPSPRAG